MVRNFNEHTSQDRSSAFRCRSPRMRKTMHRLIFADRVQWRHTNVYVHQAIDVSSTLNRISYKCIWYHCEHPCASSSHLCREIGVDSVDRLLVLHPNDERHDFAVKRSFWIPFRTRRTSELKNGQRQKRVNQLESLRNYRIMLTSIVCMRFNVLLQHEFITEFRIANVANVRFLWIVVLRLVTFQ